MRRVLSNAHAAGPIVTCVNPPSELIWIDNRWPEPSETSNVEEARPLVGAADVVLIVSDAQPLPDEDNDALKLRPAMSCSIA